MAWQCLYRSKRATIVRPWFLSPASSRVPILWARSISIYPGIGSMPRVAEINFRYTVTLLFSAPSGIPTNMRLLRRDLSSAVASLSVSVLFSGCHQSRVCLLACSSSSWLTQSLLWKRPWLNTFTRGREGLSWNGQDFIVATQRDNLVWDSLQKIWSAYRERSPVPCVVSPTPNTLRPITLHLRIAVVVPPTMSTIHYSNLTR